MNFWEWLHANSGTALCLIMAILGGIAAIFAAAKGNLEL